VNLNPCDTRCSCDACASDQYDWLARSAARGHPIGDCMICGERANQLVNGSPRCAAHPTDPATSCLCDGIPGRHDMGLCGCNFGPSRFRFRRIYPR